MPKKFNPCIKCGDIEPVFRNIYTNYWYSSCYIHIKCQNCSNEIFTRLTIDEHNAKNKLFHGEGKHILYLDIIARKHWNKANPLPDVEVKYGITTFNKAGYYSLNRKI